MHTPASTFPKPCRRVRDGIDHEDSDGWSIDQSVEFFTGTLAIDAELGLAGMVSHETHRNRAFFSPYSTAAVLKRVPRYYKPCTVKYPRQVC